MNIDFTAWAEGLERLRIEKKIAGMSVAVTDREEVLYEQGFGVTSVEKPWDPMTPRTLSRIASCTKMTVGLCVMQLVEQGKLDLDLPVDTYIPWFTLKDAEAAGKITLRKLLSHTAGLPREYTPDGVRDENRFGEVLKRELETLELIADPDANHYLYSNFGVRIAALILQYVTGKKYSEVCQEMVLDKLGMELSTFDICKAATYEMALPHVKDEEGDPKVEHMIHINAARYAAGGLYSNAHEMTALARIKLNGGAPLISRESFRQMATPIVRMDTETEGYYGLTMMQRHYGDKVLFGHTGSNPPYYSCIWTEPESGYGVAFTVNTEGGQEFTNKLIPELFAQML